MGGVGSYRSFLMIGVLGLICLLGVGFLASDNRRAVRWRTVGGAFAIQLCIGLLVFGTEGGQWVLLRMTEGVQVVIEASLRPAG